MSVLVTGGTGFIGRVLVERLAAVHGAPAVVFWRNTGKLQVIWTETPIEFDAGLTELVATLVNVITRL